ncbi:hypothetical protein UY844_25080, partial [Escherichia coli]|nr:hypothetical protein [Escherichia coli]
KTALLVAPLYVFVAAWALWLRVAQYGWTVDRLQGALAMLEYNRADFPQAVAYATQALKRAHALNKNPQCGQ